MLKLQFRRQQGYPDPRAAGGSVGVKYQFVSKIPGACNIKVGFPVSTSVNCDAAEGVVFILFFYLNIPQGYV
ncbi:hypothetical protein Peur_037242 [Populus x canadensis]